MSESHKFKNLAELTAVFPDVPWKGSAANETWVYNEKEEEFIPVTEGQYVVKIADRYEVHDEEPAKAKPAEAPEPEEAPKAAKKTAAPKEEERETVPGLDETHTVSPEKLASKPADAEQ